MSSYTSNHNIASITDLQPQSWWAAAVAVSSLLHPLLFEGGFYIAQAILKLTM